MANFIKLRQWYFASLFSIFVYYGILVIILGKTQNIHINDIYVYVIAFSSLVEIFAVWFRIKGKLFKENIYRIFLILGHLPTILGFIFSLIEKNYLYFLIAFPVFIVIYVTLIPWSKK